MVFLACIVWWKFRRTTLFSIRVGRLLLGGKLGSEARALVHTPRHSQVVHVFVHMHTCALACLGLCPCVCLCTSQVLVYDASGLFGSDSSASSSSSNANAASRWKRLALDKVILILMLCIIFDG